MTFQEKRIMCHGPTSFKEIYQLSCQLSEPAQDTISLLLPPAHPTPDVVIETGPALLHEDHLLLVLLLDVVLHEHGVAAAELLVGRQAQPHLPPLPLLQRLRNYRIAAKTSA